jgi:hypothetical protein
MTDRIISEENELLAGDGHTLRSFARTRLSLEG